MTSALESSCSDSCPESATREYRQPFYLQQDAASRLTVAVHRVEHRPQRISVVPIPRRTLRRRSPSSSTSLWLLSTAPVVASVLFVSLLAVARVTPPIAWVAIVARITAVPATRRRRVVAAATRRRLLARIGLVAAIVVLCTAGGALLAVVGGGRGGAAVVAQVLDGRGWWGLVGVVVLRFRAAAVAAATATTWSVGLGEAGGALRVRRRL